MEYPVVDMVATGERINHIRKERKITVREMAEYLGFNNPKSIYRWFRGETLPTLENIYALSLLFGVTVNDLIIAHRDITSLAS